ncbi:MAG: hypothetical protein WBH10_03035 [Allopontixanthobacter sediminis]
MKIALFAATALLPFAPIAAQDAPAAEAGEATAAKYTLDTPIETLAADPAAKAVLDKHLPGTTTHASYDMFKTMSLRAVQPFSGGAITDEILAQVERDLAAIK